MQFNIQLSMKRIALLSIVLLLTQGLVAQKSKTETTKAKARQYSYELKYRAYTMGVEKQDTSYSIVRFSNERTTKKDLMDFGGQKLIRGLATETYFVDYEKSEYALQLEYEDGEVFFTKTSFPKKDMTKKGEEKINGYKCEKYTTSINSNSIEIWVTKDLGIDATPMAQFSSLGGVMVKYVRNGSSVYELAQVKKEKKGVRYENMTPSPNAKELTYRELDNVSKEKMIITTKIFDKARVHWGDTTKHLGDMQLDSLVHFAGGTIVLKKVNIEALPSHYQLFAELTTQSAGDAYDRTGSVFVIPQDKEKTFYDALSKGIDQVPFFTSKKGSKYQGMTLTEDYTPVVELIRFFTPFGVGHFNDRLKIDGLQWEKEVYYKQEITDLTKVLRGEVLIGVFIGNYDGGGHLVSLDIKAYPGGYSGEVDDLSEQFFLPLFNTCNVMEMAGQNYPHFFDTDSLCVTFELPEGVKNLRLRYITTGHGGWGGGDEFNPKENTILLDNERIYSFTPWREDCGRYREWNPVSGNFWNGMSSSDLSRSGWCPGTATQAVYINLGDLQAGKHTLKVAIPQGKAEGGSFSAWSVSGVLLGEFE